MANQAAIAATAAGKAKPIRLQKPADWPIWLSFVKRHVQQNNVWELVNPDIESKPGVSIELVEPEFDDSGNFSIEQYAKYEARKKLYKDKMKPFLKREKAFKTLVTYIQATISVEAAVFLSNEDAHLWNLLHTLKLHYSPTDSAKKMKIEARCRELNRGPGNQKVDK